MAGHGVFSVPFTCLSFFPVFGLIQSPVSSVSAGVSVTSSNTGVPDISGSVYTKTQVITDQKSSDEYSLLTRNEFAGNLSFAKTKFYLKQNVCLSSPPAVI